MFTKLKEQYWHILVNTLLAVIIGVMVGTLDALFGRVLIRISEVRNEHIFWFVPFLALAGVTILFLYHKFNEQCLKGMTLVFQTGLGDADRIPKTLIPLVMISTWLTHLCGGSAGREGVAVQLGATVSHAVGKKLNMPDNSRILLISGMAAGFAGLFQTPIAATLFAMEVLIAGVIQYETLLPALTAAFVASNTSHFLGLEKFSINISESITWSFDSIWKIILVSVIFGIVGGCFAFLLKLTKKYLAQWIKNPMYRIMIVGAGLSLFLLVIHVGRYCGLGTNLINLSFSGEQIYSYDWILKLSFTIITLSAGFQGGEVTPLFSIGACLGVVLGSILGLPIGLMAALGYIAVFGSATNTVLAPIMIGIEVFGPQNAIIFAIACFIAYVFNGNQTIYGVQRKFDYFEG